MRNYIFLITMFVLLLCLGCGSAGNLDENVSVQDEYPNEEGTLQEGTFSYTDMDDPTPAGSEVNTGQEDSKTEYSEIRDEIEYVSVHTEHIHEEYVDRESGKFLVDMNYHVVSLEEGNETLKQNISKWMVKRQQDLEEDGLELMIKAKNKQKETGKENLSASLWHEITLYRADNHLISFVDRQYTYAIDTWNTDYRCVNFDAESGKSILLNDLLVDKEGFRNAVIAYCIKELENMYTNCEIDDAFADEIYKSVTTIGKWCLDASGFVFVYEDDPMKYSNDCVLFVHVPYDEVLDYMNPKYIWGDTYGVAALVCDETASIVAEGTENEVLVQKQYDEYYTEQLKLIYGNTAIDIGKHIRMSNIYLMRHRDWNYLIVTVDMASDDYQTYFYELKKNGIGQNFCIEGGLDSANVRADSFHVQRRLNVLGTYQIYPEYFILKDGGVASNRSDFEIEHFNYESGELLTIRELPVVKNGEKINLSVESG